MPFNGKDDAGKVNPLLLSRGCAGALWKVTMILHHGGKKYSPESWKLVPNGKERYLAAAARHWTEIMQGGLEAVNDDFGMLHIDHLITDLLFVRQLMLDESGPQ